MVICSHGFNTYHMSFETLKTHVIVCYIFSLFMGGCSYFETLVNDKTIAHAWLGNLGIFSIAKEFDRS